MDEAETATGAETTILARMTSAGIAEPRAREHLARAAVRLEGVVIEDPTTSAPKPQRWTIGAL